MQVRRGAIIGIVVLITTAAVTYVVNPSVLQQACLRYFPRCSITVLPPPSGPNFPEFDAQFISQLRSGTPFIVKTADLVNPDTVPRVQPMVGEQLTPAISCVQPGNPIPGHSGAHVHFLKKSQIPIALASEFVSSDGLSKRRGRRIKVFSPVNGQVKLLPCGNPQVVSPPPPPASPNVNLSQYGMRIQFAKITSPAGGNGDPVEFTMAFEPFDDCMFTCDTLTQGQYDNCESANKSPYCQFYKVRNGDWVTKGQYIADMWVPEPANSGVCNPPPGVTAVGSDTSGSHIHFNIEKFNPSQIFMCPDIFDPAENVSSVYQGSRCVPPSECSSGAPQGQQITCPANQPNSLCIGLRPDQMIF